MGRGLHPLAFNNLPGLVQHYGSRPSHIEGRQRAADATRNSAQQQQQQQGLAAPHDEFTVPGEPTAADVCKRAFSNLSDDSVVNLLRAVFAKHCLLRVMDQIPSGA
ncbi:hypothetical protein DIPPA_04196 [Diplonema papillatum]|nr:hypothetical protein DIPPA_04196 [Diplonema papillatum]